MRLILLFLDGYPVLVPEEEYRYDKSHGAYYPLNPNFNGKIGPPSIKTVRFVPMHQAIFQKYCIMSSVRFELEYYFLFCKNKAGKESFLIIKVKPGSLRDLKANGLILTKKIVVTAGKVCLGETTPEECTIALFNKYKSCIRFSFKQDLPRSYMLNFFNDRGELFYTQYQSTYLSHTKINVSDNDLSYIMKF
ncbi:MULTISPECIES: hypothetical protein [Ehrlichia]|uniref:Uncharacterized protein n=1 Tax=Ehrlichia cf. muris str. EmCRT TaxID=1359167 RepID=A0A0F3NC93_9RICK|nr:MULTISPECIES: hypothetical protein [Ehrlichia]KJV65342.1 hypothetical protein EMUCRT_0280 [Ehrlichia cf. muris str. EmCRT]OUC04869.1 hypothetical protein DB91_00655 [Ehrlichia sp. Wisconsin_h]